jgi:hypothetical protein
MRRARWALLRLGRCAEAMPIPVGRPSVLAVALPRAQAMVEGVTGASLTAAFAMASARLFLARSWPREILDLYSSSCVFMEDDIDAFSEEDGGRSGWAIRCVNNGGYDGLAVGLVPKRAEKQVKAVLRASVSWPASFLPLSSSGTR